MLARGLIIIRVFFLLRTAPKHRSTHISNYQSTEHEIKRTWWKWLDEIPVYPQAHLSYHKRPLWPVLFLKRIWLPCCTFVTTIVTCWLQIILLSNYSTTFNFSTCRHYPTKNYLSFPSAPCWVWHSYLSKRAKLTPYTCGSSRKFSGTVAGSEALLVSGNW